jgi:hypothetical protein
MGENVVVGFALSISFHKLPILIFLYTLLFSEGQKDDIRGPSKSKVLSESFQRPCHLSSC